MKIVRYNDADFAERLREATAPSSLFDAEIEQRTRAILDAVHARGDAMHRCSARHDARCAEGSPDDAAMTASC